jgi:predicted lipase
LVTVEEELMHPFVNLISFKVEGALMLSREGYAGRIDLMSFGMPRIGNHAFSKYFDATVKSKWRVVNQKDIGELIVN